MEKVNGSAGTDQRGVSIIVKVTRGGGGERGPRQAVTLRDAPPGRFRPPPR